MTDHPTPIPAPAGIRAIPPCPLDVSRPEILAALMQGRNLVLSALPGAGKSSRVPLWLMDQPWLEGRRMPYNALPVDGQWIVPHTRDKLLGACAANLLARGAEPDMAHLAAHLEGFRNQNGEYVERTEYSLEMLIWQIS